MVGFDEHNQTKDASKHAPRLQSTAPKTHVFPDKSVKVSDSTV